MVIAMNVGAKGASQARGKARGKARGPQDQAPEQKRDPDDQQCRGRKARPSVCPGAWPRHNN
jgi:hypothetical protein